MTPSARLQAVMDIVTGLASTAQPADRFIRDWFAARRFAGSSDRRDIGERVFNVLRRRFYFAWRMGDESARALVIASLLAEGKDPETLFTGGYGPAPLSDDERKAIATPPADAPAWVTGEYPQVLEAELTRRFGVRLPDEMAAMLARAPLDLRVNTLKASRDEVVAQLKAEGLDCTAIGTNGIRCAPANFSKHALFLSGAFEIQDLAAQIAAERAGARPGMRVLDLAAGAGGKALALAAAMQNEGEIIACDIRGAALAELEKRAARAGVTIIRTRILSGAGEADSLDGGFDLVFVDAPCSGSGTWRRQPELKSRLTPERLAALHQTQDGLLAHGAACTASRSGISRLVYATCSLLPSENEDRIEAFLVKNPDFARSEPDFLASPAATAMDGFFAAFLTRI
jgi:16S rRNA (cytosine967-C5)-methyltransferase